MMTLNSAVASEHRADLLRDAAPGHLIALAEPEITDDAQVTLRRMVELAQQRDKAIEAEVEQARMQAVQPRDDAVYPPAHVRPQPAALRTRGSGVATSS